MKKYCKVCDKQFKIWQSKKKILVDGKEFFICKTCEYAYQIFHNNVDVNKSHTGTMEEYLEYVLKIETETDCIGNILITSEEYEIFKKAMKTAKKKKRQTEFGEFEVWDFNGLDRRK